MRAFALFVIVVVTKTVVDVALIILVNVALIISWDATVDVALEIPGVARLATVDVALEIPGDATVDVALAIGFS